ncbi:hypothetical protein FN960_16760 [Alkalicoccobacillus porphyridii]|uniref:Nucleotidyltransferase domain-containing protein n=2 Tax=Alkalicoccobacillus porphyridii TaxID=2597270 RepID=A0A553ZV98_9BACI|nr:hypothetical protein FN960_16760 [Alkalicoccobacillus porphyridii]
MNAIELDLKNDKNILGIFYGGSIGNRNSDLYSDIDLRIVVKDEFFEEYRLNKKQRAKNWGNVLFFEDFPWATYSVVHYDTFMKVDSFYYRCEDLQPSVWLNNIKIIYDNDSFLKRLLEKSTELSYIPSLQEVEIWRTKVFAYLHEIYRRIMRNELYYALRCLDDLRLSLVTAWHMELGYPPNSFGDWTKVEGERSHLYDWQLKLLEEWYSNREPDNILKAMNSMIPEFIRLHQILCDKVKLDVDSEWIERILKKVPISKDFM